ncbi:MAG: hypothetical protein HPY55_16070 [Firmicutes bacterium]|nr:hypothetical protein [Bacillota bacterium]
MRILAAPDLHCYWPNYSRTGEDGTPSRLADWRRTTQALIDVALEHGVKAALFPGDLFANSRPSPQQVAEVLDLFLRLETSGISVVACAGNHDILGPGQMCVVDLIGQFARLHSKRWGITRPDVVVLDGLNVVVLPSTKIPQTDPDPAVSAQKASAGLVNIARGLVARANEIKPQATVLMGHWAISGCRLGAGNVLAASEPTLPLGELQGLGVLAVVMGHIHVAQILDHNPIVLHTGTLERHDFGEENTPTGCYVIDLDRGEAEFVPLPARQFVTIKASPEWLEALSKQSLNTETATINLVRDAIVRVIYTATQEQAKRLDHGAIIRALEAAGAHQVAGIYPEIIRSERARAQVTETTSPLDALDQWLALRTDISGEIRQRVRHVAEALMREVA